MIEPFGSVHLIYLILLMTATVFYAAPQYFCIGESGIEVMRWSLFWILLLNELWWFLFRHFSLEVALRDNLPFHLCDFGVLILLATVIWRKKVLFEMSYYVTVTAGLLAVLYPNVSEDGAIKNIAILRYFLTHIVMIVGGFHFTVGSQFFPNYKSVPRCLLLIHGYGLFVALPNYFFGTNYFYVFHKPANPAFLPDLRFPFHQLAFSGVYIIVVYAMYGAIRLLEHHQKVFKKG